MHWNQNHFIVLYKIIKKRGKYNIYVSDPAQGLLKYNEEEFKKSWLQNYDTDINGNIIKKVSYWYWNRLQIL